MRKKGLQRTPFPHLETGVCTINYPQILCFLFFFPRLWDVKKAREFQRLFLEKISKERKREMAPRVYTLWNLWCDGSKNWNERLRVRERKVAEKKTYMWKTENFLWSAETSACWCMIFHSICASKSVRTFYEITMLPSEDLLVLVNFWFFCHVAMV